MWRRFTGCGHEILGWIMQVEQHCQEAHNHGQVITFQMFDGQSDELVDTFDYTVP